MASLNSKYLWLLDNGHGGVKNGVYQTSGKRSPKWSDGTQLFEGEFNRAIVQRISEGLDDLCIDNRILVPELEDASLMERVKRANVLQKKYKHCIYISIHSNAGGGSGWEVFTSKGETRSDKIASVFLEEMRRMFPEAKMRCDYSDNDVDKEANFYVLQHTLMPAILTENFFMDNEWECKNYLMSETARDKIAKAHINAIVAIELNG